MREPPFCHIMIQEQDFCVNDEYQRLKEFKPEKIGAICNFIGLVREFGDRNDVSGMFLEHYPGMTERSLQTIVKQASSRWKFDAVSIIHRIGSLNLSDQIVFVGVSSAHRADAFAVCEFIMDYLKTSAPFWKKEITNDGSEWVEAKQSDLDKRQEWSSE